MSAIRFPLRIAAASCILLALPFAAGCKGKEAPKAAPKAVEKVLGIPHGTIAYMSEGSLRILRKGGKPEALLEGALWFPVISPDCTRVAYWEDRGPIMMLSIVNTVSRQITKLGQWNTLGTMGRNTNLRNAPCWSSDSSKVWFADGRQIWEMGDDGSNPTTIYEHPDGGCYSVTASPDGKQFAFVGVDSKSQNLWVYSTLTHQARQVTEYPLKDGAVGSPAWSPSGDKIAFVLYKSDESNIWVLNMAGGQPVPLTREGRTNSPAWDRDGKRMAVASGTQNPYAWQVALVSTVDAKFLEQLTDSRNGALTPSIAGDW